MIVNSMTGLLGDRASLLSPRATFSRPTIVTFSYYFPTNGSDSLVSLTVKVNTPLNVPVLQMMVPIPDDLLNPWHSASICVPAGMFYLEFVATHGEPYMTHIAVDNVHADWLGEPCQVQVDSVGKSLLVFRNVAMHWLS